MSNLSKPLLGFMTAMSQVQPGKQFAQDDSNNPAFGVYMALIKNQMKQTGKKATPQKPADFLFIEDHTFSDGKAMPLLIVGKLKKFKNLAKLKAKLPKCARGKVFLDFKDENGATTDSPQICFMVSSDSKIAKNEQGQLLFKPIKRALKLPFYFKWMDEAAMDAMDEQEDSENESEDTNNTADAAEEPVNVNDLAALYSETQTKVQEVNKLAADKGGKLGADDVPALEDLYGLCVEFLDKYDIAAAASTLPSQLQQAKGNVEKWRTQFQPFLLKIEEAKTAAEPTKAGAGASKPATKTVTVEKQYNAAYDAVDTAKGMYGNTKYWVKAKMKDGSERFFKSSKDPDYLALKKDPNFKSSSTQCNVLTYDLTEKLIGKENSPFNFLPMGRGYTNANVLTTFLEKADGVVVDALKGEGRFEKAWQAINAGKLVYFSWNNEGGIGHVNTGLPTPELRYNKGINDYVGRIAQAGAKVGEYWIDEIWGKDGLNDLGIYVGKFQTPLPEGGKQDPNLFLAIYDKITSPVGRGYTEGYAIGKMPGKMTPEAQQDAIANIKVVQQLLQNAGQTIIKKVDGACGDKTIEAIENVQRTALGMENPTGFVAYGDPTWLYLLGLSKGKIDAAKAKVGAGDKPNATPNNPPKDNPVNPTPNTGIKPEQVQLDYDGSVPKIPNANAEKVLREVLAQAGETDAIITSTVRSVADQAKVLYYNMTNYPLTVNAKFYNGTGTQLVLAFEQAAAKTGATPESIQKALEAAINSIGAAKVSDHCNASNPAIDIHPQSLKNRAAFNAALLAHPKVNKSKTVIPPKDPYYHIVING